MKLYRVPFSEFDGAPVFIKGDGVDWERNDREIDMKVPIYIGRERDQMREWIDESSERWGSGEWGVYRAWGRWGRYRKKKKILKKIDLYI